MSHEMSNVNVSQMAVIIDNDVCNSPLHAAIYAHLFTIVYYFSVNTSVLAQSILSQMATNEERLLYHNY